MRRLASFQCTGLIPLRSNSDGFIANEISLFSPLQQLNMKNLHLLLVAFCFALISCTSRSDKAAAYNDSIIEKQTAVIIAFDQLDAAMTDLNEEEMSANYLILRGRVKESIQMLDSLGKFQDDEDLLKASKDLFQGYDELMEEEYGELINILAADDSSFTPEVQQRAYALQTEIFSQMKQLHQNFTAEQRSFGERYNVIFEEEE